MVDNIIFMIFCWLIAFIYLIILCKEYSEYDKGDKFQLVLLFLGIFVIHLILLIPIFKIILDYN